MRGRDLKYKLWSGPVHTVHVKIVNSMGPFRQSGFSNYRRAALYDVVLNEWKT